ncbi:hypothetical protein GCM10010441_46760 [Kitasatospora paracochleata]|uniref:Type IV secretory pathway VirB2 component (Pilin) n=1 Tax=Kitasatospora paracochleata TaxID=58354 RepID=A0ABT1J640_9ACTN|nr:hypothetical protein [Kitasatospora paracochleata]MCP2312908.1 type IV secretory pathway VirB2 component (pilin) [Kitasatospora paracochleata]
MTITLPVVLVLGIATWAAIKFLGIRLWVAVVIGLFGFYVAHTFIAPAIDATTKSGVEIVNNTQK